MARTVQFTPRTTDFIVKSGRGILFGHSFGETTTTAGAHIIIRDGVDATGTIMAVIHLAPNESVRDYFSDGLEFFKGCFVDVIDGSIQGAVWFS